jgi:hypothetical protein
MLDRALAAQPERSVGPRWLVPLPRGAEPPIRVFVNGVPQRLGADYQLEHGTLVFRRPLTKEGKLGFWRWLSMFLGIAGTYRQNDSVDVQYQRAGRELVATGLEIVGPGDERRAR